MTPSSDRRLGKLEYLVMLAVVHVGEEGYSVTSRKEIEKRTGRNVAQGALYVTPPAPHRGMAHGLALGVSPP